MDDQNASGGADSAQALVGTAFHEAGRAVIAFLTGWGVEEVSIVAQVLLEDGRFTTVPFHQETAS